MSDAERPPMFGAAMWSAVMLSASQGQEKPRCQCSGQCGQPHVKGGGRCPRMHGQHVKNKGTIRLHAAPADLALAGTAAAALLPAEALRAWCSTCYDAARRTAVREASEAAFPAAEALF